MGKFEDFDLDLTVHKENNNVVKASIGITKPICSNKEICTGTVCGISIAYCPTTKACTGGCISTKNCSTKVCPGSAGIR